MMRVDHEPTMIGTTIETEMECDNDRDNDQDNENPILVSILVPISVLIGFPFRPPELLKRAPAHFRPFEHHTERQETPEVPPGSSFGQKSP